MTTFTNIPKYIEDVLEKQNGATSRRDFLKTSGLLIVSLSASAAAGPEALAAAGERGGGPGCRSVSRPRLQTARFVDRHS